MNTCEEFTAGQAASWTSLVSHRRLKQQQLISLTAILTSSMWAFLHRQTTNSPTLQHQLGGCPTNQLYSDTSYRESTPGPTSVRALSHKLQVANIGHPGYPPSVWHSYKVEGWSNDLLEQLAELGKALTFISAVYYEGDKGRARWRIQAPLFKYIYGGFITVVWLNHWH